MEPYLNNTTKTKRIIFGVWPFVMWKNARLKWNRFYSDRKNEPDWCFIFILLGCMVHKCKVRAFTMNFFFVLPRMIFTVQQEWTKSNHPPHENRAMTKWTFENRQSIVWVYLNLDRNLYIWMFVSNEMKCGRSLSLEISKWIENLKKKSDCLIHLKIMLHLR